MAVQDILFEFKLDTKQSQVAMDQMRKATERTNKTLGDTVEESKDLGKQMDENSKKFSMFSNIAKEAGNSLKTIALGNILADSIQGAISGMANLGREIVNVTAGFESQLSVVAARSGATQQELEQLAELAARLGATTQFSASQAGEALGELSAAGFTAQQQMQSLEGVLQLAAAGGVSLQESALIATSILNSFGKKASEISGVNDILAKTANSSSTDINQLGFAFQQAGAVASAAGISLEETAAAIGILANAGIRGGDAGTSLKTAIQALANPTTTAQKALSELGVQTKNVDGSVRPLLDIFTDLRAGLLQAGGVTENIDKIFNIFGSDAGRLGAILANNVQQFGDFQTSLSNAEGAAANMAEVMQDNLQGSFNSFNSAVEALQLQIGNILLPVLRGVVEGATVVIQTIGGVINVFRELPRFLSDNQAAFALLGTALLAFNAQLAISTTRSIALLAAERARLIFTRTVLTVQRAMTAAQIALNTAQAASPMGAMIAVVAALAGGIALLVNNMEELTVEQEIQKEIAEEVADQFAKESAEAQILFRQLAATNEGTEERKNLIEEINQKYGQYLGNMNLEEAGYNDILKAISLVNAALKEKIRQQIINEKIQASLQDQVRAEISLEQRLNELKGKSTTREEAEAFQEIENQLKIAQQALDAAIAARDRFNETGEGIDKVSAATQKFEEEAKTVNQILNTIGFSSGIGGLFREEAFDYVNAFVEAGQRQIALGSLITKATEENTTSTNNNTGAQNNNNRARSTGADIRIVEQREFETQALEANTRELDKNAKALSDQTTELNNAAAARAAIQAGSLEFEIELGKLDIEAQQTLVSIEEQRRTAVKELTEQLNQGLFDLQQQRQEALQEIDTAQQQVGQAQQSGDADAIKRAQQNLREAQQRNASLVNLEEYKIREQALTVQYNDELLSIEQSAGNAVLAAEENNYAQRVEVLNEFYQNALEKIKENRAAAQEINEEIIQTVLNDNINTLSSRRVALDIRFENELQKISQLQRDRQYLETYLQEQLIATNEEEAQLASEGRLTAAAVQELEARRQAIEAQIQATQTAIELGYLEREQTILEREKAISEILKLEREKRAQEFEAEQERISELVAQGVQDIQQIASSLSQQGFDVSFLNSFATTLQETRELARFGIPFDQTPAAQEIAAQISANNRLIASYELRKEKIGELTAEEEEILAEARKKEQELNEQFAQQQEDFNKDKFGAIVDTINAVLQQGLEIAKAFIQNRINEIDKLIDAQEEQVESVRNALNEQGAAQEGYTSEQLQLEEERLQKLRQMREAEVEKERAIAQTQTILFTAVAVAKAAAEGGIAAAITIPLLIASLVAGFIAAKSQSESAVAAAREGGEVGKGKLVYRGGKQWLPVQAGGELVGPSHEGGGIPIIAEGGEMIISKAKTGQHRDILEAIQDGTFQQKFGKLAVNTPRELLQPLMLQQKSVDLTGLMERFDRLEAAILGQPLAVSTYLDGKKIYENQQGYARKAKALNQKAR